MHSEAHRQRMNDLVDGQVVNGEWSMLSGKVNTAAVTTVLFLSFRRPPQLGVTLRKVYAAAGEIYAEHRVRYML